MKNERRKFIEQILQKTLKLKILNTELRTAKLKSVDEISVYSPLPFIIPHFLNVSKAKREEWIENLSGIQAAARANTKQSFASPVVLKPRGIFEGKKLFI